MTLHTYKGYITYTPGSERGYYLNPDTCELVKVKKSGRVKKIIKTDKYYFKNMYDDKIYCVENNTVKECNNPCEENNNACNLNVSNCSSNEIEIKNEEQCESDNNTDGECQENKEDCETNRCFFKLLNGKIKKCKNINQCLHCDNSLDCIKSQISPIVKWKKLIKAKSCSHCIDNKSGNVEFKSNGVYEIISTINYYINDIENKVLLKDLFCNNLSSISLGNIADNTSFIVINNNPYNIVCSVSLVFLVTLNGGCSIGFATFQVQQIVSQSTANITIGFCGNSNMVGTNIQEVFITSFNGFMISESTNNSICGSKGYLKFNIESDCLCNSVGFSISNLSNLLCTPVGLPYTNIKSYIPAFALIKNDCKVVSIKYLSSQKISKIQLLEAAFNTFALIISTQLSVTPSNNCIISGPSGPSGICSNEIISSTNVGCVSLLSNAFSLIPLAVSLIPDCYDFPTFYSINNVGNIEIDEIVEVECGTKLKIAYYTNKSDTSTIDLLVKGVNFMGIEL
ncbi:MAG: hypothetical protein QW478_00580 [Candidatus Micrarchaeaceae archaeon]